MGTKRASKAEIRRMTVDHTTDAPLPTLDPAIEAYIDGYAPRELDTEVWATIRPFVIDTLHRYAPERLESGRQRLTALTAYAAWAHARGYELERWRLLDLELIEAFAASADLGRTTAANYRSRLRGIARKLHPAAQLQTTRQGTHQAVKPPYTEREVAAIVRIARTQPSPVTGRQLRVCVGLGLGAGLDSSDLKQLRGRHVTVAVDGPIRVEVPGSRERTVWVREQFEPLVRDGLKGLTAGRLLLGQDAKRRNVAARIFGNAHILGNAPKFEQSRMRTTWLASLLRDGVPLPVIMDAAGLRGARTLTDLLPHVIVEGDHVEQLRGVRR